MKNIQTLVEGWGVLENNNSNKSTLKNSQKSIKAFSLIELSIVLIIMGLLVAGITGGQSLIQSAKIRSFINEANNYRQAVNTFYTMNERLPGDENNYGNFCIDGDCSGTYAADIDFDKPFKDLYDAGIIDFKAEECEGGGEGDDINLGQTNCNGINAPRSKAFKNGAFIFSSVLLDGNYLSFKVYYSNELSSKVAERIDQTIDDGKPGTGNVRAYYSGGGCGNYFVDCDDYNDAEGGVISTLYFKLDV